MWISCQPREHITYFVSGMPGNVDFYVLARDTDTQHPHLFKLAGRATEE